jgi:hypothetical protein
MYLCHEKVIPSAFFCRFWIAFLQNRWMPSKEEQRTSSVDPLSLGLKCSGVEWSRGCISFFPCDSCIWILLRIGLFLTEGSTSFFCMLLQDEANYKNTKHFNLAAASDADGAFLQVALLFSPTLTTGILYPRFVWHQIQHATPILPTKITLKQVLVLQPIVTSTQSPVERDCLCGQRLS